MIEVVSGKGVGAGKSFYVTTRILTHLAHGGTVYATTNYGFVWDEAVKLVRDRWGVEIERDQFIEIDADDTQRLHEVTRPGTAECPVLIVLDEVHAQLNARDWQDSSKKGTTGRAMFNWLTQSRHDDNDLIFISQNAHNIDRQIMRLVTYNRVVRNMKNFAIPGLCRWPLAQFVVSTFDVDGKTPIDSPKWMWHDKGVFRCYHSKVMRGSHKRAGEQIPRRSLKKIKSRSPMIRVFIILAVVAGIYGAKTVWASFREGRSLAGFAPGTAPAVSKPQPKLASVSPGAPGSVPAATPKPAYRIEQESFRGTDGFSYLRTDKATYELHTVSVRGVVKSIMSRAVLVVAPDGERVVIVASDDSRPLPAVPSAPAATPAPASKEVVVAKWEPQKSFGGWIEADEERMDAERKRPVGNFKTHR